jgi:hypothetical protein
MVLGNGKKIKIIIPENFVEKDLSEMINKFKNLKEKFIKLNPDNSLICFDLGKIKNMDFFGFQYIYYFYRYLKIELKIQIIVENKSAKFFEFEKKYGLDVGELDDK